MIFPCTQRDSHAGGMPLDGDRGIRKTPVPYRNGREVPFRPLRSRIAAFPLPADARPPSSLCDTRAAVSDGFLPPLPPPSSAVPDKMRDRSDAAPAICAHTLASSSSSRRSDAIPVICHSPQSPTGAVRFQDMEQQIFPLPQHPPPQHPAEAACASPSRGTGKALALFHYPLYTGSERRGSEVAVTRATRNRVIG